MTHDHNVMPDLIRHPLSFCTNAIVMPDLIRHPPSSCTIGREQVRSRLEAGMTHDHKCHAGLDPASAFFFNGRMNPDWQPCVYILARGAHSTLYTGVTSDLPGRVWQHREGLVRGFTTQYGIKRLVWFEAHDTMETAIIREKRIKRWPRAWKYDLIHSINPAWRDLAEDFGFDPLPPR